MKIGICTDSVASLSDERLAKHDISAVNLHVNTKDKSYTEKVDIDVELFEQLRGNKVKLKSSQPSPEAFKVEYEKMRDKGYTDIISIHPTHIMTGTVNSARLGAELVEGVNIHIFEGNAAAFEEEMQIDFTLKMIEEGKSPEEIIASLKEMLVNTENYFLIEDLMVLADSGRIPRVAARVGDLIKLKTMIRLDMETGFSLVHKFRTSKKIINQFVKEIVAYAEENGPTNVYISQVGRLEVATEIKNKLADYNVDVKICGDLGPVLRTNFGTHGMGVCWSKKF